MSLRVFYRFLVVLALMIVGLMALGAGVRTMNAGLSCPDWPLCFGKIVPDFHVAVWFEFVHRAYAGIVAIAYAVALFISFRRKDIPPGARLAAKLGLGFLVLQIVMGGLTVLMQIKAVIVTAHLLLATLFFCCVLWMLFHVREKFQQEKQVVEPRNELVWPRGFRFILPILVFVQIAIGGFVASTYAGMICVDWPYCNGQWVPTLRGPMGIQIIHRFYAYALVVLFIALNLFVYRHRRQISKSLKLIVYAGGLTVVLQTAVGILNLIYFIPPLLTVLHQTLAITLLAIALKISFEIGLPRRFGS